MPPQGVHVMATATDIEAVLTQVMEGLKARNYVFAAGRRRRGTQALARFDTKKGRRFASLFRSNDFASC
jgi:hypothetical protein